MDRAEEVNSAVMGIGRKPEKTPAEIAAEASRAMPDSFLQKWLEQADLDEKLTYNRIHAEATAYLGQNVDELRGGLQEACQRIIGYNRNMLFEPNAKDALADAEELRIKLKFARYLNYLNVMKELELAAMFRNVVIEKDTERHNAVAELSTAQLGVEQIVEALRGSQVEITQNFDRQNVVLVNILGVLNQINEKTTPDRIFRPGDNHMG